jgi:hypothetical protein
MHKVLFLSADGRVAGTQIIVCEEAREAMGVTNAVVVALKTEDMPAGHGRSYTLLVWQDGGGDVYVQVPFVDVPPGVGKTLKVSLADLTACGIKAPRAREARLLRVAAAPTAPQETELL